MRLGHFPFVVMLVAHVMNMAVLMLEGFMMMLALMPLREMQPDPNGHQRAGDDKLDRQGFGQKDDRQLRKQRRRAKQDRRSDGQRNARKEEARLSMVHQGYFTFLGGRRAAGRAPDKAPPA